MHLVFAGCTANIAFAASKILDFPPIDPASDLHRRHGAPLISGSGAEQLPAAFATLTTIRRAPIGAKVIN